MAYLTNKYLANIKKWELDLSKYNDGVYDGDLKTPYDIKEFRGFKELFGFEIKEVKGSLFFWNCTSLTSIPDLPDYVGENLSFYGCNSLTSISNLPKILKYDLSFTGCTSLKSLPNLPKTIGRDLSFWECESLTSIGKMPSVVNRNIWVADCPFFKGMTEKQIREKYDILLK